MLGVIGNPVAHSKSPALHNAALAAAGERGCYLPLLVDSLPGFLAAFDRDDFTGFSVTIPHKEAALQACAEVDPVAASIGAVNTLVRLPGGGFKGYNTDWEAAVDAIEMGLGGAGTLSGRSVVVLGAGGAARALVFGALARGASSVTVANRTLSRAQALAESAGVQVRASVPPPPCIFLRESLSPAEIIRQPDIRIGTGWVPSEPTPARGAVTASRAKVTEGAARGGGGRGRRVRWRR